MGPRAPDQETMSARGTSPCAMDLEAAIAMLDRNYAGYRDKVATLGEAGAREAARESWRSAQGASTPEECDQAIRRWLATFQDPHLRLVVTRGDAGEAAPAGRRPSAMPQAAVLSDRTVLVRVPSFDVTCRRPLEALLAQCDREIRDRPNLLIDVRGNGGGSDATYRPLIPYLYTRPIEVVGVEVWASPDNIREWEKVLDRIPESEKGLRRQLARLLERLRAHPGEFVPGSSDSKLTLPTVLRSPERVAILIDERCTSSCEEFLLAARQSDKVVLFGRPTGGALDYSNVLSFALPSGARTIGIPSSRSRRLPGNPIDGVGIAPDVLLERASSQDAEGLTEVERVRRCLEGEPVATSLARGR